MGEYSLIKFVIELSMERITDEDIVLGSLRIIQIVVGEGGCKP